MISVRVLVPKPSYRSGIPSGSAILASFANAAGDSHRVDFGRPAVGDSFRSRLTKTFQRSVGRETHRDSFLINDTGLQDKFDMVGSWYDLGFLVLHQPGLLNAWGVTVDECRALTMTGLKEGSFRQLGLSVTILQDSSYLVLDPNADAAALEEMGQRLAASKRTIRKLSDIRFEDKDLPFVDLVP